MWKRFNLRCVSLHSCVHSFDKEEEKMFRLVCRFIDFDNRIIVKA